MNQRMTLKASQEDAFLFCDTHCHLDDPRFSEQLDTILQDAYQNGVREILVPAVGQWNWQRVLTVTQKSECLYPALGLHPLYISQHKDKDLQLLESMLEQNQCVAVGEIGLDFSLDNLERSKQEKFLIEQIEIANRVKLPITFHSRKSHDILSKLLKAHTPVVGGAIHAFTGSYEQAKRFIDLGLHIGVGGAITYPRAQKTRNTISRLPIDTLMLETDAPDMPISGFQGEINTPSRVKYVFEMLIELKNGDALDMCNRLRKMARALYFE